MSSDQQQQAVTWLERDSLRHCAQLKMLAAYPDAARAWPLQDGQGAVQGAGVIMPVTASEFDRRTYPQCQSIVMPATEMPQLALKLCPMLGSAIPVWKMHPDIAACLSRALRLHRVTAYVSYTGIGSMRIDHGVIIRESPPTHWLKLLPPSALESTANSIHFASGDHPDSAPVCVARAWPIYGDIWEIGGLFTLERYRGQGWATRVVAAAMVYLSAHGRRIRYLVREDNAASIAVARRLDLHVVGQLEHWLPDNVSS